VQISLILGDVTCTITKRCYLYDYKVVILVLIRISAVYSELSIINLLLNHRPYVLNLKCAIATCGLCLGFDSSFSFRDGLGSHPSS